jgi:hypothetical protein
MAMLQYNDEVAIEMRNSGSGRYGRMRNRGRER